MKKILGIVILAVLIIFSAGCVSNDEPDNGGSTVPPVSGDKNLVEEADKIAKSFGSYNGKAIQWRVLTVDEKNEKALLISRNILDKKQFHEENPASAYWESSSLREWLNEDFLNSAFTSEEQKHILDSPIHLEPNSEYGTSSGNPTTDKIFLLSEEEVNRYFADNEDRRSESLVDEKGLEDWWTLTSGESEEYAVIVLSEGSILTDGYGKDQIEGVRPAIWVSLADEE